MLEGDLETNKRVAACLCLFHTIVLMSLQQILCHRRYDGSREKVRCEHREDNRLGQRNKEVPSNTAEEEHRHKYDADREGRNEGRNRNLCSASQNGIFNL